MRLTGFEKVSLAAWAAVAAAAAAIGCGLLTLGTLETHVHLCLFRFLTGIPCPGCGMAHALLLAWQGDWAGSFSHHPLGIPLLALWTLWVVNGAANAARGRAFSEGFSVPLRGAVPGVLAIAAVLAVHFARLGSFPG